MRKFIIGLLGVLFLIGSYRFITAALETGLSFWELMIIVVAINLIVVIVHEAGHFTTARLFGIPINGVYLGKRKTDENGELIYGHEKELILIKRETYYMGFNRYGLFGGAVDTKEDIKESKNYSNPKKILFYLSGMLFVLAFVLLSYFFLPEFLFFGVAICGLFNMFNLVLKNADGEKVYNLLKKDEN